MKSTILVSIAHYKPGWKFGGPTRTVANLVDHFGDEYSFRILTSDRDFGDEQPFAGIPTDRWLRVGKADVLYLPPAKRNLFAMGRLLQETAYDVLYLNSFFQPVFTIGPLLAYRLGLAPRRPCILAPRGECASAALQIKHWKKAAFMRTAGAIGLYSGLCWQASSPFEAGDIERVLPAVARDIMIAGNLPPRLEPDTPPAREVTANGTALRLVLLSRLSRMKNVEFALDVVASCPVPVSLDIWGTIEDEAYWRECEAAMASMPDHVQVAYRGPASHERVPDIMASYDVMFLPTRGENYGHVIAEALSAGTPVLISDRTPWRNLAKNGVGWDLPIDAAAPFQAAIMQAAERMRENGAQWRRQVQAYACRTVLKPEALEANRQLFAVAAAQRIHYAAPAENQLARAAR